MTGQVEIDVRCASEPGRVTHRRHQARPPSIVRRAAVHRRIAIFNVKSRHRVGPSSDAYLASISTWSMMSLILEVRDAAAYGSPAENGQRSSAVASVRHSTRLRCASQVNFYLACHVVDVFSLWGAHGSKWGMFTKLFTGDYSCKSFPLNCIVLYLY